MELPPIKGPSFLLCGFAVRWAKTKYRQLASSITQIDSSNQTRFPLFDPTALTHSQRDMNTSKLQQLRKSEMPTPAILNGHEDTMLSQVAYRRPKNERPFALGQ